MPLLKEVGDRWYEVPLLLGAVLADVQGTQRGDGLRRGIGAPGREIQRPCKRCLVDLRMREGCWAGSGWTREL